MNDYTNLSSVINEIKTHLADKETLLQPHFQNTFQSLIKDAGEIANLVENISSTTPNLPENKNTLELATNIVFDIHSISPPILSQLLEYSGVNNEQLDLVIQTCEIKEKSHDKSVCHLFESHALELSLIDYPKNKELFNSYKKISNKNDKGNSFDSFVKYLIEVGAPNLVLEQLAKLTVYQKQYLQDHLDTNLKFQNIYNKFVEHGEIKEKDIEYAKKIIYKSILDNVNKYPLQLSYQDGIPVAKLSTKKFNDNFITERSPSGHVDAWGVKDGKLLIYCVTNYSTFENQKTQATHAAYAVFNGIQKKLLPGINNLEVIALCKPLLCEEDPAFKNFHKQLNSLVDDKKISKIEYNSLKYAPIDHEILKIIRNTSNEFYDKMKSHVSLGFHCDNSLPIVLKDKEQQVYTSISRMAKSIIALKNITEINPTLHLIDTVFSIYAKELSETYSLAYNAYILYGNNNPDLKNMIEQSQNNLTKIKVTLIKANSRHAEEVNISKEDEDTVRIIKQTYNETYEEEQKSLISNSIPEYAKLKSQTTGHNVNFDNISAQNISNILNDRLNSEVNQSLLVDTLLYKVQSLKDKYMNFPNKKLRDDSYGQLCYGLIQGVNKSFDLNSVFEKIKEYPELEERIANDKGLQSVIGSHMIKTNSRLKM